MTRCVAVTGLGIVSSIGNNKREVTESLRLGCSGISFCDVYAGMGFRSQVHGEISISLDGVIDRCLRRLMGDGAAYGYVSMQEAIRDAGLKHEDVSNDRTGLIMGSGGPSTSSQVAAADSVRTKGARRVGPYMVPRCMSSTVSANLSTALAIKGISYSISSTNIADRTCPGCVLGS